MSRVSSSARWGRLLIAITVALLAGAPAASARPTLLIFHGGGFVAGEPSIPDVEAMARDHGLRPVEVAYTLGHLPAAMRDARHAARRASRLLAYGESAGAALAARLAQLGLVDAAAAWMPPSDLRRLSPPGQEIIDTLGATQRQLRHVSPGLHRTRRPVLAQIADQDVLIPTRQSMRWARRDPRVKAQLVPGSHYLPVSDADREFQLRTAIRFLVRKLGRTTRGPRAGSLPPIGTGAGAPFRSSAATSAR